MTNELAEALLDLRRCGYTKLSQMIGAIIGGAEKAPYEARLMAVSTARDMINVACLTISDALGDYSEAYFAINSSRKFILDALKEETSRAIEEAA